MDVHKVHKCASRIHWHSTILQVANGSCDGTVLGDESNKGIVTAHSEELHQENSKLLIFYLICLNPLNLKLSKIREEKRRGLDLLFLMFLNFFLVLLKSTCYQLLMIFKKKLSAFKEN